MKIKKIAVALIIATIAINSYSQNRNEIRIFYGVSDSELLRNVDLVGGGSYTINNFSEYGLKYLRQIKGKLNFELGLNLTTVNTEFNYITHEGLSGETRYEKLEIISIPINANYTVGKYFFASGGPILDFQTSNNSSDSQSGIGYNLGVGLKYEIDNMMFFVNPNFKRHAVIPFEKEKYHQKLTEVGVQFGVGYKF